MLQRKRRTKVERARYRVRNLEETAERLEQKAREHEGDLCRHKKEAYRLK